MKALVKQNEVVTLQDVTLPQIAANQVLIKVACASLCRTDVFAAEGKIATKNPLILGHEMAGTVVETGSNATLLVNQERVTVNPVIPCYSCDFCMREEYSDCQNTKFLGVWLDGAFAEYIAVDQRCVYPIADDLSFVEATYSEPVAASLAVIKADIKPQHCGLIYGDNRIAHLTLRILEAHGFDNVTIHSTGQNLILNHYDFIIETLATTKTLSDMIAAIRPRGLIVFKSRQYQAVNLQLHKILAKEPRFQAVNYGCFKEAIQLLSSRKIQVSDLIGQMYRLDDFEEAFQDSLKSEARKLFFQIGNA